MKKDIKIIIQARELSERYPKKIFKKIKGKYVLQYLIETCLKVTNSKNIFLALSKNTNRKILSNLLLKYNCNHFFGSEKNVLKRYWDLCNYYSINNFVRLTADNILIHSSFIKKMIKIYNNNKYDYIGNVNNSGFPEGYSVEVLSKKLLHKVKNNNFKPDTEHITVGINFNKIKCLSKKIKLNKNYSSIRLTLDYPEDLNYITKILKYNNYRVPTFEKVIKIANKYKRNFSKQRSLYY
jgi:spore coat polysaccharide biosynthesis protein SpsF (cytidylyltransferase family)